MKVLDLENNNLTNSGQTKEEVKDLAASLDENSTLLHLNLANNNMEETIGTEFVIHTDVNKTLICFEFGLNDFILPQVLEIQKNLRWNKAAYDAMRLREWKERKRMAEEEALMRTKVLKDQAEEMDEEENEKSWMAREKAWDEQWDQMIVEQAVDKEQLIQRLEQMSKLRGSKKKKRRGGGKKKKK